MLPQMPVVDTYLFSGRPSGMHPWGIAGSIEDVARQHGQILEGFKVESYDILRIEQRLPASPYIVLFWDLQKSHIRLQPHLEGRSAIPQ